MQRVFWQTFWWRGTRSKPEKTGSKYGANKEEKIYDGISSWKLNVLPYNHLFPPMNCSQMIVNWLLSSVSENVPHFWTLISNEVKHINRGPHQDLSDFLYSGNTNEIQWILFYFQLYAMKQRSWMVLKLFFNGIIFWLKYLCFFGHTFLCVFFFQI